MKIFGYEPLGGQGLDVGLLLLRLTLALPIFLKHGLEKVFTFSEMSKHFPDPVHIGVVPSLIFALISDFICTLLVMSGLFARIASGIIFVNLLVAWAFVHHFEFFGHGSDHGEVMIAYLGMVAALILIGPGRFSIDKYRNR